MNSITTKELISLNQYFDTASILDIRMGQIIAAERVPKSYGLKLTVSFGPDKTDDKIVFTNLGKDYEPEALLNRVAPFIINLEPVEIKGVKSEAMILALPNSNNTFDIGTKIV